jgi:alpha-tubulin suppressor-like RCC1 family protein
MVAVTSGPTYTCGLTAGGKAYCWGDNGQGQFGDGTTNSSFVPAIAASGRELASISSASLTKVPFTCGVTNSGGAYCWGSNLMGNLGNGTTRNSLVPTAVAGDLVFTSVSVRAFHACGLT